MTDAIGWRTTALLLLPAASWFLVLLVLPLVVILVYSLGERAPEGGYASENRAWCVPPGGLPSAAAPDRVATERLHAASVTP